MVIYFAKELTHWGRATHICINKLTIIASNNALSPGLRQAIIWNNARILSIGFFGTNFSEISIEILTFSLKKMRLPFCRGLNVLRATARYQRYQTRGEREGFSPDLVSTSNDFSCTFFSDGTSILNRCNNLCYQSNYAFALVMLSRLFLIFNTQYTTYALTDTPSAPLHSL